MVFDASDRRSATKALLRAAGAGLLWVSAVAALAASPEAGRLPRQSDAPSIKPTEAESGAAAASSGPATPADQSWTTLLKRVYKSVGENRVIAVAAGITFFALLAIFPAIAALLSIYGAFADIGGVQSRLASLAGVLPEGALAIIGEQVTRIASKGARTLGMAFFVSFAASLWSANAGMKALLDGLNVAYGKSESRGFVKLTAVSLAFTAGAIVCLLLAMGMVVIVPVILDFIGLGGAAQTLVAVGRWPALLAGVVLGLALLYRYGPSPHGATWRWITPGSAIAAMLWFAASAGFSYYAAHFGSYNETYGSLGAAVGFMTWIWISMIVILLGAELNGKLE